VVVEAKTITSGRDLLDEWTLAFENASHDEETSTVAIMNSWRLGIYDYSAIPTHHPDPRNSERKRHKAKIPTCRLFPFLTIMNIHLTKLPSFPSQPF
jgi:hypothetical protein